MDILIAASEAVPFSKTGGLADVCGALPAALTQLGHRVTLITPCYRTARECGRPVRQTGVPFDVWIDGRKVTGHFARSTLSDDETPVILVEHNDYFDRNQLYAQNGRDYQDNCERFVFFSRAVFEAVRLLNLPVDVIHANDWQTGLVPAYLKIEHGSRLNQRPVAAVFTIHNLAYQGKFWHWDMPLTGLDWRYFNYRQMEAWGHLNLLKTGLVFSDMITTVSPRYAEEIQNAPLGCGMEPVLQHRSNDLAGILNGIDPREWNPATDPHLPARYDLDTLREGKPVCKTRLQDELGLPRRPEVPMVGLVSRLVDQKGIDLVADVMHYWAPVADVQWVILGTGESHYHDFFSRMMAKFPNKVAARFEFSNPLAHRMEAGLDMFLIPSRFEPCGLTQLYSLEYGTVPIVRDTGGLADTITDAQDSTLAAGVANGFCFRDYNGLALGTTLSRACEAYARPDVWNRIVATGMRQDWSWSRSAEQYAAMYEAALARAKWNARRRV